MPTPDQRTSRVPGSHSGSPIPGAAPLLAAGLVLTSVMGFGALTARVWRYTVDDAFITFRYAENLARGWGLTFNQAPPRAEGYTSVLWTLVMTLPHLTGIDAVLFSKLAGICLTAGTAFVLACGIMAGPHREHRRGRVLGAAVAVVLFLGFPYGPVHAVSGMETALAAFLYAVTGVFFLRAREGGRASPLLPLSCLVLGLTRPESNLFSVALLGLVLASLPRAKRRRFAGECLAFYVLPGVAYFAWRYTYYGALLPLSFYVKSARLGLAGLGPALWFARALAIGFAIPLLVFAGSTARKHGAIALPMGLLLAYFLTIDHMMGYGHRYFVPLVPLLSLLAGAGFSARFPSFAGARGTAALILCMAPAVVFGPVMNVRAESYYLSYARGMERAHVLLGRSLASALWRSNPVLAIGDAGAVPYYSRLETIDTFGLNDPTIARNQREDRSGYVLSRDPTVVVLISRREDVFDSPLAYENALYRACVEGGFDRRVTLVFNEDYYLWVLWRDDSTDAPVLDEVLVRASRRSHAAASRGATARAGLHDASAAGGEKL